MAITDAVVLPEDVIVAPVTELHPDVRAKIDAHDDEFSVTRRFARSGSKIVDQSGALLLAEFRTPGPIVDVVVRFSRERDLDPKEVLAEAYPMLRSCIDARFLVPADSADARRLAPKCDRGENIGSFEVVRHVQLMEDMEVYQARCTDGALVAVKIVRQEDNTKARDSIERESAVLERLQGNSSPRLLEMGEKQGRPFLATTWHYGVSPITAAGELRESDAPDAAGRLLGLCGAILCVYTGLHRLGVIHGDVHPKNILIDRHGVPTVIDFGLARFTDGETGAPRGGVGYYLEPEFAAARLAGRGLPTSSEAGEQYAVAALLYFLVSGEHYLSFPLAEQEFLSSIVNDSPLPLSRSRWESWPEFDRIIGTALQKNPNDRFTSMDRFAEAWKELHASGRMRGSLTFMVPSASLDKLLDETVAELRSPEIGGASGEDVDDALSMMHGASGVAYALYRLACIRDDPSLLFCADGWLVAAEQRLSDYDPAETHVAESDPHGPYLGTSGVHAVRVLIGRAMGDLRASDAAVAAFVEASGETGHTTDLMLGRTGALLTASLLFDSLPSTDSVAGRKLLDFGADAVARIWEILDGDGVIYREAQFRNLGMAHGWAGCLYATMQWCRSSASALPRGVERRLDELAGCAVRSGRGAHWPWVAEGDTGDTERHMPGWCNGSAGFVFLWTLAHRTLRRQEYLALAEEAAWSAWEGSGRLTHLCCGLAGRAYALVHLHQHSGRPEWLERAMDLANRAALNNDHDTDEVERYPATSLYRGELGVALLAADLAHPEGACMPLFAPEGWPVKPHTAVA